MGGVDLVTPVAGTDYTFGTGPTDSSLTASLAITATTGGNAAIIELTNNAAVTGFVTRLQIRGRGLYDYDSVTLQATDATSKTAYGEYVLSIDLPHEARQHVATSVAAVFLADYKYPRTRVDGVQFRADLTDALRTAALDREPGDLVTIAETVSGVNATHFINGVQYEFDWPRLTATWILAPDLETGSVFILNTSTLNGADVLGW